MEKLDLQDVACISIIHTMACTRVYYIHRLKFFFVYTSNMDELLPVRIKTAISASDYLYEMLKKETGIIDLMFYHPTTMNPNLKDITGDNLDLSKKILYKHLLNLL